MADRARHRIARRGHAQHRIAGTQHLLRHRVAFSLKLSHKVGVAAPVVTRASFQARLWASWIPVFIP